MLNEQPAVDPWTSWTRDNTANDNHLLKTPNVIALSGLAGSGKSTVADHFISKYGFSRVKFAGPLKDMCRAVGMTDQHIEGTLKEVPCTFLQGKTPRYFQQMLGTEFGRELIGQGFWTCLWAKTANDILNAGGKVIVDDCRFENEAETVRLLGGTVIKIEGRGGIAGAHASEAGVDADIVMHNTGSIRDLLDDADRILLDLSQ